MRMSKTIMGTGVTIDIPDARNEFFFDLAFGFLESVDRHFSPYKEDSELSRYQRGEISDEKLSRPMKMVKLECERYQKLTDGYFSAYFNGLFDPTGYVKGWAIKKVGDILKKEGRFKTFCISVGGDILAASDGSKEWVIGIQDPRDREKILNKLSIFNGAVATSGSYERGQHIINPKTGKPANSLLSVTITGPDIVRADVLATAVFAMGRAKGEEFMRKLPQYQTTFIVI